MNVNLGIKRVGFLYDDKIGADGFNEFIVLKEKHPKIKEYDANAYIPTRGKKYMSNSSKLYCNLAYQCVSGVNYGKNRIGLYNCTDIPHLEDSIMFDTDAKKYGINGVSPMFTPNTLANVCSGQMAILSGINAINFTMTSCAISVANAIILINLHICENFIDAAVIVSMENSSAMHDAIRLHRLKTSTEQNSPELGASILIGNRGDDDLAVITHTETSLSMGNTVETVFEKLFSNIPNKQIEVIVIDSGMLFIDKSIIDSIVKKFGINAHIIYLEEQTGICDNTGSILSILYSISSFNKDRISRILACSFDISGYVSVQVIEKGK